MNGHLVLIACGAPLSARVPDVAAAAAAKGWTVGVVATHAAMGWIDATAVKTVCGSPPLVEFRLPNQPKRGPQADAYVACPATFNTINKVALGLADNYATGLLCEAIGARTPVVMFPMMNEGQWRHPALESSLRKLRESGVGTFDIRTGAPGGRPIVSGTGTEVADRFDPNWVLTALD